MTLLRRLRHLSRPLRHQLAYLALRAFVGGLRRLPLRGSLALGGYIGRAIGGLARADSARIKRHLRLLECPPSVGECWADLGRRFCEFACATRLLPAVEIHGLTAAKRALESGDGALVATLHLGNWELMAAALSRSGLPVCAIAARPKRSPLHRWLAQSRTDLGVQTLSPGTGARRALSALKAGQAVALFVDQNTGAKRVSVDFMGRPAPTSTVWERLLTLTDAQPWLAWTIRQPDGVHRVTLEPAPRDLQALTDRVEVLVRSYPEQWIWLHDRWTR